MVEPNIGHSNYIGPDQQRYSRQLLSAALALVAPGEDPGSILLDKHGPPIKSGVTNAKSEVTNSKSGVTNSK